MREVISEIKKQNVEMKRIESKLDVQFKTTLWVVSILLAVIVALKIFV